MPVPLRYWIASSRELTASVHTIIRCTIGQYYVTQAVQQGAARGTLQLGSITLDKLAALVPLPRQHQVRYGGCLAPHSHLRAAIIPTPSQQGVEAPDGSSASPNWTWARLLKRVFAINMERCPVCQQGRLRIIAAITADHVIQNILRHLKLAVDPPPIAPAQQAAFAWGVSSP